MSLLSRFPRAGGTPDDDATPASADAAAQAEHVSQSGETPQTASTDAPVEFGEWSGAEESTSEEDLFDREFPAPAESAPDASDDSSAPIELEFFSEDDAPTLAAGHRGGIGGTIASVVFHVWLLLTLGVATYIEPPLDSMPPEIEVTQVTEEEEEPEDEPEVEYELAEPDERDLDVQKVVHAASVGLVQSDDPERLQPPQPISVEITPDVELPSYDLPEGIEVSDQMEIVGTTGQGLIEIESALDRITWEVANHLQESRVLLVWVVDGSGSLDEQRKRIADRLERVYGELGALDTAGQIPRREQPLLTGVVAYGSGIEYVTPEPTADFREVQAAIENLPVDASGRENIFTALYQTLGKWGHYRLSGGRRILLVTVTDETGDDFAMLEPAIKRSRRYGAHCYVVGPSAVFGRRQGYVDYVAPEDGETYQLGVDLGPETPMISRLQLPFWSDGPSLEYISSGFGPYGLSRLVSETGGVYFMSGMTTMETLTPVGNFTGQDLKDFEPDYSFATPDEYLTDIMSSPLRRAVYLAAKQSTEISVPKRPGMDFRIDENNFRQTFDDAQRTVAIGSAAIDRIGAFFPADPEAAYAKETSKRWRASFDLAFGRLLAMRVRMLEYNLACAEMEASLTEQEVLTEANLIHFRPSTELNFAKSAKRYHQLAREHLTRVIQEAPGTPWAMLAARELAAPMGIRVEKEFIPPPTTLPDENDGNNGRPGRRIRLAPDPRPMPQPQPPPQPKPKPVLPRL